MMARQVGMSSEQLGLELRDSCRTGRAPDGGLKPPLEADRPNGGAATAPAGALGARGTRAGGRRVRSRGDLDRGCMPRCGSDAADVASSSRRGGAGGCGGAPALRRTERTSASRRTEQDRRPPRGAPPASGSKCRRPDPRRWPLWSSGGCRSWPRPETGRDALAHPVGGCGSKQYCALADRAVAAVAQVLHATALRDARPPPRRLPFPAKGRTRGISLVRVNNQRCVGHRVKCWLARHLPLLVRVALTSHGSVGRRPGRNDTNTFPS